MHIMSSRYLMIFLIAYICNNFGSCINYHTTPILWNIWGMELRCHSPIFCVYRVVSNAFSFSFMLNFGFSSIGVHVEFHFNILNLFRISMRYLLLWITKSFMVLANSRPRKYLSLLRQSYQISCSCWIWDSQYHCDCFMWWVDHPHINTLYWDFQCSILSHRFHVQLKTYNNLTILGTY